LGLLAVLTGLLAAIYGRVATAEMLIGKGADLDAKDKYGSTPFGRMLAPPIGGNRSALSALDQG
jgi:hypothetical protein